ncbi:MAG TPA: glycoside hydrolase family 30 beta sandwich domain-containing protein [Ohtaekwangia sp.]|nr:glycoside hydrolase family 30 beta sandwich domain-containing protein [Ohtaekwangia sp.]
MILSACKDDEDEATFRLTVNGGSGSGLYPAGEQVTIAAAAAAEGESFAAWTGDIDDVQDVHAATTIVTMPAEDITVNATYQPTFTGEVATVTINSSDIHQTMDGFGFFGARDVWWSGSDASRFYSDAWLERIIGDLGITIWRNEAYPHNPPDENTTSNQDADWDKQKPMIQALKAKADEHGVDLKVILTAWSPPGEFKWEIYNMAWAGDDAAERGPSDEGDYWSEKNGGTLNPNKYDQYAQWWIDVIQMYKDIDVGVYAISLQNEPLFPQEFNSGVYTTQWYADMIAAVVPTIKAAHPEVKVYGSENMLEMEGKEENWQWFYHNKLKQNPDAMEQMDILAVHGYQDGVNPSSGSELGTMWSKHLTEFVQPLDKKAWMTETSGYVDAWQGDGETPGAFGLAIDIQSALLHGDVSAWVYWQGSSLDGIDEYNLMSDLTVGKKYHASKNFYRFIRPGAVRVSAVASDEAVSVSAFDHEGNGTQTLVLINTANEAKGVELAVQGGSPEAEYEMFVTSATKNCESAGTVQGSGTIVLPARSVVTLHAGGSDLGD